MHFFKTWNRARLLRARSLALGLGGLVLLGGCESMNNTDKGLITGGVLGGALGTVVGGISGHPGAGAAIGAASGALIGGVAGNAEDKAERRAEQQAVAWNAQNPPLSLTDIVRMAQSHISDDVIIRQIESTNSAYTLRPQDIEYLKQMGVSDRVVMVMQTRRPGPVVRTRPASTVYVVEPAPPPVSVGFGFGYGCGPYRRHCW